eukprot:TRINITY_DN5223_c0_g1_i2.p1 TRINITY_DN5223_c0_g1~~TRINITY_DN5223_c0_g1_i2.p1  ORF type:complete len:1540 (-),score=388.03 TRINITY_DN5223_c0_g1_i2:142-4761(-)
MANSAWELPPSPERWRSGMRDYSGEELVSMSTEQLLEVCGRLESRRQMMGILYTELQNENSKLQRHQSMLSDRIVRVEGTLNMPVGEPERNRSGLLSPSSSKGLLGSARDGASQPPSSVTSPARAVPDARSPPPAALPPAAGAPQGVEPSLLRQRLGGDVQLSVPEELLLKVNAAGVAILTWFYDEQLLEQLYDERSALRRLVFEVRQQSEGANGRLRTRSHTCESKTFADGNDEVGEQSIEIDGCMPGKAYAFSVRARAEYHGRASPVFSAFSETVTFGAFSSSLCVDFAASTEAQSSVMSANGIGTPGLVQESTMDFSKEPTCPPIDESVVEPQLSGSLSREAERQRVAEETQRQIQLAKRSLEEERARHQAEEELKGAEQQAWAVRLAKEREEQRARMLQSQALQERRRVELEDQRAEQERLRLEELERQRAEENRIRLEELERQRVEEERRRLEELERQRAEAERQQLLELERQRVEEERRRLEELERQRAEAERQQLLQLERQREEEERRRLEERGRQRAEDERRRMELERQRVEEERLHLAELERQRADEERRVFEELKRQRLEEERQLIAEQQRRQAEEEERRRQEEAAERERQIAAEAERQRLEEAARARAEAERRRLDEEAKRRVDLEKAVERKAEEVRRQVEEEVRQKAAEEAKRRDVEEAKMRAALEEERKRRAEAEARAKAEEAEAQRREEALRNRLHEELQRQIDDDVQRRRFQEAANEGGLERESTAPPSGQPRALGDEMPADGDQLSATLPPSTIAVHAGGHGPAIRQRPIAAGVTMPATTIQRGAEQSSSSTSSAVQRRIDEFEGQIRQRLQAEPGAPSGALSARQGAGSFADGFDKYAQERLWADAAGKSQNAFPQRRIIPESKAGSAVGAPQNSIRTLQRGPSAAGSPREAATAQQRGAPTRSPASETRPLGRLAGAADPMGKWMSKILNDARQNRSRSEAASLSPPPSAPLRGVVETPAALLTSAIAIHPVSTDKQVQVHIGTYASIPEDEAAAMQMPQAMPHLREVTRDSLGPTVTQMPARRSPGRQQPAPVQSQLRQNGLPSRPSFDQITRQIDQGVDNMRRASQPGTGHGTPVGDTIVGLPQSSSFHAGGALPRANTFSPDPGAALAASYAHGQLAQGGGAAASARQLPSARGGSPPNTGANMPGNVPRALSFSAYSNVQKPQTGAGAGYPQASSLQNTMRPGSIQPGPQTNSLQRRPGPPGGGAGPQRSGRPNAALQAPRGNVAAAAPSAAPVAQQPVQAPPTAAVGGATVTAVVPQTQPQPPHLPSAVPPPQPQPQPAPTAPRRAQTQPPMPGYGPGSSAPPTLMGGMPPPPGPTFPGFPGAAPSKHSFPDQNPFQGLPSAKHSFQETHQGLPPRNRSFHEAGGMGAGLGLGLDPFGGAGRQMPPGGPQQMPLSPQMQMPPAHFPFQPGLGGGDTPPPPRAAPHHAARSHGGGGGGGARSGSRGGPGGFVLKVLTSDSRWETLNFTAGDNLPSLAASFLARKGLKAAFKGGLAQKMGSMIATGQPHSTVDIVDLI